MYILTCLERNTLNNNDNAIEITFTFFWHFNDLLLGMLLSKLDLRHFSWVWNNIRPWSLSRKEFVKFVPFWNNVNITFRKIYEENYAFLEWKICNWGKVWSSVMNYLKINTFFNIIFCYFFKFFLNLMMQVKLAFMPIFPKGLSNHIF